MAAPIAIGAVDALVSNTNGCKAVPVRPRLWVRKQQVNGCKLNTYSLFFFNSERNNGQF
jgi:hypothetical protein